MLAHPIARVGIDFVKMYPRGIARRGRQRYRAGNEGEPKKTGPDRA